MLRMPARPAQIGVVVHPTPGCHLRLLPALSSSPSLKCATARHSRLRRPWFGNLARQLYAGNSISNSRRSRKAVPPTAASLGRANGGGQPYEEEMSGTVLVAEGLFSGSSYLFAMPAIQRPYDWGSDEAGALLADLLSCLVDGVEPRKLDKFLLGTINLAVGPPITEDTHRKYVVDGQQPIVTLCLLFAAARERLLGHQATHGLAGEVGEMLKQPAKLLKGMEEQLRVHMLRHEDTAFLERLLLDLEFMSSEMSDARPEGESQPKLWSNMQLFRSKLAEEELPRVTSLVQFIFTRVTFVVTESANISTSLRFFATSALRGKQLQPIDALKSYIFDPEVMPAERQEEYGKRWCQLELEDNLGCEGISRVCSHLATIHLKKARGVGNEYAELERLFQLFRDLSEGSMAGPAFFDLVLEPYVQIYRDMTTGDYSLPHATKPDADRCRYLLTCLARMPDKVADWEPLALAALMQHKLGRLGTTQLLQLLEELERLCWMWVLAGKGSRAAARTNRVVQILQEIGLGGCQQPPAGNDSVGRPSAAGVATAPGAGRLTSQQLVRPLMSQSAPSLKLTPEEKLAMREALEGPIYTSLGASKGRPLILLLVRLNEHVLKQNGLSYIRSYDASDKNLTVEHVLPQKPPDRSEWLRLFTPEQQDHWTHRLGNLVLLHGRRNARASNLSFREKKSRYKGQQGNNGIPLTDEVASLAHSGPAEVEAQQQKLLQLACACWQLYDTQPRS